MVELNLKIPSEFYKEEKRLDYTITKKQKELWAVELDLLSELLRVCRKYDLKIFANGGTLLGAVRHRGFIPWDDDIDMMMMRDQYEILCSVANKEFESPYFFQTEYTDKGSLRGHAQLRNSLTTGIRRKEFEQNYYMFNQGIFIDIFPLDAAPDDKDQLDCLLNKTTELLIKARKNARLTSRYVTAKNVYKRPVKWLAHALLDNQFGIFLGVDRYYDLYEETCKKYNNTKTNQVAQLCITSEVKKRLVWPIECFSSTVELEFEFIKIPAPVGYEQILSIFYGDWKKPKKVPTLHGEMIFDTEKSYDYYYSN